MTFEVEVCGRLRGVAIEPAGGAGRFRITIDGHARLVDVARAGELGLSLLATAVPGSRTAAQARSLAVAPGSAPGEALVYLEGRTVPVIVNGRRAAHGADPGAHGPGEVAIVAPMPGRVVRVLAAPGDEIGARQGVVVVEAMKMENELRAPRPGRVKEITVSPGTSVEAGRILAIIE